MINENTLTCYEQTVYNIFLKSSRRGKGFTPRKKFNNIQDETYVAVKKIAKTLKNKKIDPEIFFNAPYLMYEEKYVPLKHYSTFSAISTYRKYTQQLQLTKPDDDFNITQLRNSMKFIYIQCVDNNILVANEYLNVQNGIYPNFILDLKQGNICFYSLLTLGLSECNIKLEKKIVDFACKDFYNMLSSLRSRYLSSKKIKPLSIKLIKTINKILKIK